MTLERGALLHKRYRIVEILGQGGMGSVYRAVDENLGVDVAVKENLFTTDEYARQFRLEAVILANLRHPNLPRVTDHFVIGEQGQYLVMDYIEGEDLRQRMERVGNIQEDEAILLGAAICDALTYLHTRKPPILHRDLKPGNVKITPDGHIFLVDFGLAKVLHGSQATTTGARAMTPGYSPPEQYGAARTDPRTDIYSLGATLYAALTGIIPEDGLARAMDNTQLTPLRKRNSKVTRRLAAAIEKAMGIDPADRFQTAEDFKRALLGSKSKTQRLPGDYVIQPPPPEPVQPDKQNSIEREVSQSVPAAGRNESSVKEPPVFKPRRKRRKNRLLSVFLWLLFLFAAGFVGVVRFMPQFVPPYVMSIVPVALLAPSSTPTFIPTHTDVPTATATAEVTETLAPSATFTVTPRPTLTLPPVVDITATPANTAIPVATPLGGGGQIAFASTRSGLPQIYLVNTDGAGLVALTELENGACQPAWSPDGLQIVFISPCRARSEFYDNAYYRDSSLYLINADGTNLMPLTAAPGSDFEPAWSPDGTRIAFTSLRDGRREVFVISLESRAVVRLTTSSGGGLEGSSQPAWSPSGDRIVYTVKRFGAYQIWVMDDTGQNAVQVARSGTQLWDYLPFWSTDGELIYFSQRNPPPAIVRPWLMNVRYADLGTIDSVRLDYPRPLEDAKFSPDGSWLVYEGMDNTDGNREIYYLSVADGNRTRLTNDPAIDFDPAWRPAQSP